MTDAPSASGRPRSVAPGPPPFVEPPPGWEFLLTDQGLAALAEATLELESGTAPDAINRRLRTLGRAPEEAAALLTQAQLRERARAKFGPLASELLFTPAGLEQASRISVSRGHAARFSDAGCERVADLGCGIGTESIAMLEQGIAPEAVELDGFTARLAEHNLATVAARRGSRAPRVRTADAVDVDLSGIDGAFLDPARRTAGHRETRRLSSPDDYSPSLDFAFGIGSRMPTGVKLGPGLDRDLIPGEAEAQWVSVDGHVVETALWFGALARPGIARAALVHRGGEIHEMTASGDAPDVDVRSMGEYLYEPDGAVIRARLIGALAEPLGAGMMSAGIAYLTGDELVATPFAQTFRLLERLPVKEKALRRALAARGIGTLEIKKRGADVDPAALRARLRLRGAEHATLLLTRDETGKHCALLAERC
ncbi:THUMP-like domain-containing protein [Leucobacter sp. USHLN154]|uniref:THUMP-like domain-containing protein n=1 Tax=Leucobacter sp. USHLN154 TaxID=3081269 RepID=UPI003018A4CA